MSGGIKIPISAAFDKGNTDQVLAEFERRINKLGQQVAQANKVKFNPIERTTMDQLQRVTASFENLRRVSTDLNKRVKATGQSGSSFTDLDWAKMYPDERSRARQMQKAYSYVVGDQFQASPPDGGGRPRPGRPGGGGGSGSGGGRPGGGGGDDHWGGAGRRVVGAGLNAFGPAGGVVNGAVSAGMSGGASAGLAGLVGGIAALALGKAIGAVMEKVGQAQNEAIGYDTIKRTLGDVNVSFNVLKESLRSSARLLDMTFEESSRLGLQFAKLSGMTAEQYKTLHEEVSTSGGFGRSYGLDPSQSNAFFAQMRQYRVTTNSRESKELALMIGESVAKSGTSAKMDEVLESIAGFTAQQTRMGMNSANVGGYSEMLTGLMRSGRAGLDPSSAAALLGRVNSSIASGGAAGEAGQNFLYSAIGSRLGLNPIQAKIMQEQGAFGTGRGTFGAGSMYAGYSGRSLGAGSSDVTNLQMIKEHLDKTYGGRSDLKADAMANLLGINISQAMAMSSIDSTRLGGLSSRLKRNGVNINDVNASGISRISQIEANGSLSESEKDRQIKDAAKQNQEETEGSKTRATINGVERATVDMASKLLEPLNAMRSGIMYLAGEGKRSSRQIMEQMATVETDDRIDQIKSTMTASKTGANKNYIDALNARKGYQRSSHQGAMGGLTEGLDPAAYQRQLKILMDAEEAAKAEKEKADLGTQYVDAIKNEKKRLAENIDKIRSGNTLADAAASGGGVGGRTYGSASNFDEMFAKYEKQYGLPAGVLKATALKENRGMDPSAVSAQNKNGTYDHGLMQHNSKFLSERGLADSWDNPERSIEEAAKLWQKNLKASGGDIRGGARRYNGSGPDAEAYAIDFMSIYGQVGTPLPTVPASGGQQQAQGVHVTGEVTVNTSDGKSVVVPLKTSGRVGAPQPQGAW